MGEVVGISASNYVGRIWQFNEDEDAALEYLPHEDQVLYLRGLRKNMDFSTGIVGIRRAISYQQFKELLEINRSQGSTKKSSAPSKDQLRACIARLAKAGLVERLTQNTGAKIERLVFKLPLAHVGQYSALNKEPQHSTTGAPPLQSLDAARPREVVNPTTENAMNPIHQLVSKSVREKNSENSEEFSGSESADFNNLEKTKAVDQGDGGGLGLCPWNEILDLWKACFPRRRQPNRNLWSNQQAACDLRSRWEELAQVNHSSGVGKLYFDCETGLVFWDKHLKHLSKSKFLNSDEAKFFDFQWLLEKENFYKALDGKYNNA